MTYDASQSVATRIDKIRKLTAPNSETYENVEGAALAQTILHDTVGGCHPLMRVLIHAVEKSDWVSALAGAKGVIELFDQDSLISPRLAIAHEIEGSIVDIAQAQVEGAEKTADVSQKQLCLA